MANCPNRNAPEYKTLLEVYKTNIATDNVINNWQKLNRTDVFPTIEEADDFVKNQKKTLKAEQIDFSMNILNNLSNAGLITKYQNKYVINNSTKGSVNYDPTLIDNNIEKIKRYLEFNGIPSDIFSLSNVGASVMISIDDTRITKNIIDLATLKNKVNAPDILVHLQKMFPQIEIEVMSEKDAKAYYDILDEEQKAKVSFDDVKSFYVNGKSILIQERIDVETSIEEILHPFVDAVRFDNEKLFKSLVKDATNNYPLLKALIYETYTNEKGFTEGDRQNELVTKALSKHFKNEYETNPTKTFLERIKEFVKWFVSIINDLHDYLTGINIKDINPNATLSDIAKLLNTSDLTFNLNINLDNKVKYALTENKQKIVDNVISKSNDIQKEIIQRMFHISREVEESVETLSINVSQIYESDSIVVLNKKDHVYYDIKSGEVYESVTTVIKGQLKNKEDVELNITLGNDFDKILDGIVSDKPLNEIMNDLEILSPEIAERAYKDIQDNVTNLLADGSVIIPQVVLFDYKTKIAGTADLIAISPKGEIRIIDLKTSKNFLIGNKDYYDNEWELSDDSKLKALKNLNVNQLSTRQQHNLQVNLYRRILHNMGYEVSTEENAAQTFHIRVDVSGTGKNQVFNGDFEIEGWVSHPPSQNQLYVDALIPENVDLVSEETLDNIVEQSEYADVVNDDFLTEEEKFPEDLENNMPEFDTVLNALETYKIALVNRKDALEKLRSGIFLDKTKEESINNILNSIASIEIAMMEGADNIIATYTMLLKDALKEVEKFTDYMLDPANFEKNEYINYALNFDRFAKTFEGLASIQESGVLNNTQAKLVLNLQAKLNRLRGTNKNEGIIDAAITNYVKEIVKSNSSRDFSEEDLNDLMVIANDIGIVDLNTRDMATSTDTLLALMDKIYKNKIQEVLDKIELRNAEIKMAGSKLEKLSTGMDKNEIYDFMLELDEDGEFTGRYVQKLGTQYYNKLRELRSELFDEDGNWKTYREIEDIDEASKEDIEYNKKLYAAKSKYAEFWKAEVVVNGKFEDGEYHKYTDEFKTIREKHERFIQNGDYGYWIKKRTISDREYSSYLNKYFDVIETQFAVKSNGEFTGKVSPGTMRVPKVKFRETRDITSKGVSMLNPKYDLIINPVDALGEARKEFYLMYIRNFEDDLLRKLPMNTRDQMLGKTPIVKSNLYDNLKNKRNIVTRLWAKSTSTVKDLLTDTAEMKRVVLDENGEFVDTLPIFFTGNPRLEGELERTQNKIDALKELKKTNQIGIEQYSLEMKRLQTEFENLQNRPSAKELNKNMTENLLKFSGMAEHYETMGGIEDTLTAMLKVIEKREYLPANDKSTKIARAMNKSGQYIKGEWKAVGRKRNDVESNVVRRAKKWMSMVYYDSENVTKNQWDKVTDALINYSSLSYVAFNPFGNLNNYLMGRINNYIEVAGSRHFKRQSYLRAELEYNKGLKDFGTRLAMNVKAKGQYDPAQPMSKYEAFVDFFRMMDAKSDIRELGRSDDDKSFFQRVVLEKFGYGLQDAAEYNVQTKTGMAMVMDVTIKNKTTGETLNLYDAMTFDSVTHELKFKSGFDTVVNSNGTETLFTDKFRYDLRNKIREVNKQIHGNYARADRMIIQANSLGKLAAQFHKWVAPALRARYQKAYFDENLGWMEGRYISFTKFIGYAMKNIKDIDLTGKKWKEGFSKEYSQVKIGVDKNGNIKYAYDERIAQNRLKNTFATVGELSIMLTTILLKEFLESMWKDDDDDNDIEKRLENALIFQADRSYKELVTFIPVLPDGLTQMFQLAKSPIAASRTLGEIGEALSKTVITGYNGVKYVTTDNKEYWDYNSDIFYQKKPKKGQLKLSKEWKDVVPVLYSIQRFDNFIQLRDFYIK